MVTTPVVECQWKNSSVRAARPVIRRAAVRCRLLPLAPRIRRESLALDLYPPLLFRTHQHNPRGCAEILRPVAVPPPDAQGILIAGEVHVMSGGIEPHPERGLAGGGAEGDVLACAAAVTGVEAALAEV